MPARFSCRGGLFAFAGDPFPVVGQYYQLAAPYDRGPVWRNGRYFRVRRHSALGSAVWV